MGAEPAVRGISSVPGELERLEREYPEQSEIVEELLREVLSFHRHALDLLVAAMDLDVLTALAKDPVVAGLLALHELHPLEPAVRVTQICSEIAVGAGVECTFLGLEGARAHVRLECRVEQAPARLIRRIEERVAVRVPELDGVDVALSARPVASDVAVPVTLSRRRVVGPSQAGEVVRSPQEESPAPPARMKAHTEQSFQQESCELCATALTEAHNHLVDLKGQRLACACRACWMLFEHPGAARGRYRSVPDRSRSPRRFTLAPHDWEALAIPVRCVFIFRSSKNGYVTCYPSPAGATESEMATQALNQTGSLKEVLDSLADDVEAALILNNEGYVVPIDLCYELVGQVRRAWKGLGGGTGVEDLLQALSCELGGSLVGA